MARGGTVADVEFAFRPFIIDIRTDFPGSRVYYLGVHGRRGDRLQLTLMIYIRGARATFDKHVNSIVFV